MANPAAPLKALRQTIPRATRTALESSFKYWHKRFAPLHFQRAAFARYRSYGDSAKRDLSGYAERHERDISRGRQTTDPLTKSGRFQRAFLSGSYRFGAGMKKLRITFPGLPRHIYRRNQFSEFSVADAVTDVPEFERQAMKKHFVATLGFQVKQKMARQKTFGRAVF